ACNLQCRLNYLTSTAWGQSPMPSVFISYRRKPSAMLATLIARMITVTAGRASASRAHTRNFPGHPDPRA
ncbi:MAG: hypothetical protein K8S97_04770, partial [Anaerolineae bacterium]|nr:hypothetical protein [Anaerolineae bacterium]